MTSWWARLWTGSAFVGLVAMGFQIVWWNFTIDDAHITARCAENLAHLGVPSFNPTDALEVSSSPLSVWALALATRLGLDAVLTAKALGFVAGIVGVLVVHRTVARRTGSAVCGLGAGFVLATAPGWGLHAVGGLETPLFGLAVLAAVLLSRSADDERHPIAWGLVVAAVSALRPEGLLLAVLFVAWAGARRAPRATAAACFALGAFLVVRFVFHASIWPVATLAKPNLLAQVLAIAPDMNEAIDAVAANWGSKLRTAPLVAGWIVPVLFVAHLGRRLRQPSRRLEALAGVFGLLIFVVSPRDWMPEQRYLVPFLPILLLGATDALREVLRSRPRLGRHRPLVVATAVTLACGWQVRSTLDLHADYASHRVNAALDARSHHERIGNWIRENIEPDDSILAYEIGAVGRLGNVHVVDHEGIAHRAIARIIARSGSYEAIRSGRDASASNDIVDVCDASAPAWFLVRSRVGFEPILGAPIPPSFARSPLQRALLERFGANYRLKRVFEMTRGHDRYLLLQRKDPK